MRATLRRRDANRVKLPCDAVRRQTRHRVTDDAPLHVGRDLSRLPDSLLAVTPRGRQSVLGAAAQLAPFFVGNRDADVDRELLLLIVGVESVHRSEEPPFVELRVEQEVRAIHCAAGCSFKVPHDQRFRDASLDRSDCDHHEMARNLREGIRDRLLVPRVIAEVCYLLSERAGATAAEVDSCGPSRPATWSWES